MNNNLKRVQVYLDSENVYRLDQVADKLGVSRSSIIRDAVGVVAQRLEEVLRYTASETGHTNPLLEMAGIEQSRSGDLSLRVDEIYASKTREKSHGQT